MEKIQQKKEENILDAIDKSIKNVTNIFYNSTNIKFIEDWEQSDLRDLIQEDNLSFIKNKPYAKKTIK